MGAAPMAYVLWTRFLRHAPTQPDWSNRDRSCSRAGHASMLLYSLLHLTGYDLPLDDLQQLPPVGLAHAGTPRIRPHPGRRGHHRPARARASPTPSAWPSPSAAWRPSSTAPATTIIDHWTYGICSDGDLQEGIAPEAASLAGHLRLGKLIFLYDDNHVQLDGPTSMAWSEDVLERFDAYGWHTQRVDGRQRHRRHRGRHRGRAGATTARA